MKRFKKGDICLIGIFLALVLINALSWISTGFSDFYVQKIYPVISAPFIFLMGHIGFSVGEIMIIIFVLMAVIGIPAVIIFVIVKRKDPKKTKTVLIGSLRVLSWILAYIFATETLGCFVMYHCTTFSDRYFEPTEHTEELLLDTLGAFSQRIADIEPRLTRDQDGYIVLSKDPDEDCKEAMKKLGEEYSQLKGYYPNPKRIINSFFMAQEGIIGLYIPFAFEATYNRDIQPIAVPATVCHELSHLKGIIQENEASFTAVIACLKYGSDELKYSACLDAFYYLYKNALELKGTDYEDRLWEAVAVVPQNVWDYDIGSYRADYWEKNADKEIIPTETVSAISDAFTEANLTMNGVKDGINAYNRVVELLMDYYASGGQV